MSRLPTPGSDDNTWGDILNDYLAVAHNTDGSIKTGVITTAQIADGTITTTDISSTAGIVKGQLASAVQSSLGLADTALQSVPDASSNAKGVVQLAGDLGGSAAAPTTPTAVHLAGAETITGVKTFNASPSLPNPTNSSDGANKSYIDSAVSTLVSQSQLTSYAVDPNSIGAYIVGANGITISETSTQITIGYSGTGSSGGGIGRTIAQVSAATTAAAVASTDYVYYWSGSTAYTLTMPTAASNTNRYTLKNAGTVSQPVNTTSSQTIEGGISITISAGNSVDLISNGTNWMVI